MTLGTAFAETLATFAACSTVSIEDEYDGVDRVLWPEAPITTSRAGDHQTRHHHQRQEKGELTSRHIVECLEMKKEYKNYKIEIENHLRDEKVVMDVTRQLLKKTTERGEGKEKKTGAKGLFK